MEKDLNNAILVLTGWIDAVVGYLYIFSNLIIRTILLPWTL
jgi:hypothetical protein